MANKNPNLKNLKKNTDRTPEERKELAKKAGIASGKARNKQKTMREMLDYLLSKEITNNRGEVASTLELLMTAVIQKALRGDVRAVKFIRDTIGQMPIQKHEIENTGINIVVQDTKHQQMLEDL